MTTPTSIAIDAGSTRLRWAVGDDGRLHQIGFGAIDLHEVPAFPVGLHPLAYPTHGEEPLRDPALRVTHADGTTSTRLRHVGHTEQDEGDTTLHRIELEDRVAPLTVTLMVRAWPDLDVLEQWVEVHNRAEADIVVHRFAASAPSFAGVAPGPHLTHWGGGWAGEWTETGERLTPGTKTVASAGGVRPSLYRPPVVLVAPAGPATENHGEVGLCTVVWGGDVRFDAEVALHDHVRLIAGHQHRGAERRLGPDERISSPHALWTWSTRGVGPTSRAMHRFVRRVVVRDGHRIRPTVFNTWEAVGFSLEPERLNRLVDGAAEVGAELFLLDDGWFGDAHRRDDDTAGLGDWTVDRAKFPDGLTPLIDRTRAAGLRFGLWVEPEMVNPSSEQYEQHPERVIAEPGRPRREERQQLVLDLCRPEVQEDVVDTIDRILTDHPDISYLKWDANRDITEPGSTALAPDRQTHLALDRVSATDAVMAEVARRHPDVELMLCASGGGRSDLHALAHFHEIWTSDNTDPVDRVRIQWGASHLLPAGTLGAHVTRWGQRPLDFACAVAMSGRFGFDLDLDQLDEAERAVCRDAARNYREVRDLVQQGDLHRLVSPVGSTRCALGYVDRASGRSVLFAYRLPDDPEPVDDEALELPWLTEGETHRARDLTPRLGSGRDDVGWGTLEQGRVRWPSGDGPVALVVEIS